MTPARLPRFTDRARDVLTRARAAARDEGAASIHTRHMLAGVYAEGQNLALRVLASIDVETGKVAAELSLRSGEAEPPAPTRSQSPSAGPGASRCSGPAAALELAAIEAIGLGHNYIGCEHLLLGIVAEPDGAAGKTLRGLGVDPQTARRAVVAALAGYVHPQAQTAAADPAAALAAELRPLTERVARLEAHAGLPAAVSL